MRTENIIVHRQRWGNYESYYFMDHLGRGMIRLINYFDHDKDEAQFWLTDFYVQEGHRNEHIGTSLIRTAMEYCEAFCNIADDRHRRAKIAIEVNTNYSEQFVGDWYERLGFKKIGTGIGFESLSDMKDSDFEMNLIRYEKEIDEEIDPPDIG